MLPAPFPPLREELSLHPGQALASGEPSHILEDPVRNQFFRIDWTTFEVLKRWSLANAEDILLSIRASTPLDLTADDVLDVLKFLGDNQLLQPDPLSSPKIMAARLKRMKGSVAQQLLHHYLFFRIPLLKPDRWLTRIAPSFDWVFSSAFARLTMLALIIGGVQVFRNWDRFSTTLLDTFTLDGLFSYGLALIGVKCAHELGHAITAKRRGCRVPSMGIAFLVLWPVPYTDTSDVWRLGNHRHRQQVAAAGVATELVIAVWSTLAWALLPDGMLRSIVFPLATTTWLATLAINTSPFMRFDGYFLLSDWLDMPNLHARAFALARWQLREMLFALGDPPPEHFSRKRRVGLILFAWGTWIYRLTLFLGIAVLVYHFFIKLLGIFLFAVEITWFVMRPIASELATWRSLWPHLKSSKRARRTALLAIVAVLLFIVPWPARIHATGVLRAAEVFPVHAPPHAQVLSLPVREGQTVKQGQVLMQFSAPENDGKRRALEAQVERLRWESSSAGFDPEQRARSTVLREELATAEAALAEQAQEAARNRPVAPFAGQLRDIETSLAPGVWVTKDERLAVLVADSAHEVSAYLDESAVQRVAVGDSARFYADGLEGPFLHLTVTGIDRDATRALPSGMWSAPLGGSVPSREKQGMWFPEHAVYRVTFSVDDDCSTLAGRLWRGKVVIAGKWEAPGARFIGTVMSVIRREAGF